MKTILALFILFVYLALIAKGANNAVLKVVVVHTPPHISNIQTEESFALRHATYTVTFFEVRNTYLGDEMFGSTVWKHQVKTDVFFYRKDEDYLWYDWFETIEEEITCDNYPELNQPKIT